MHATIGIVDCIFHYVCLRLSRFLSSAWGIAVLLPSRQDGNEQKRHRFFCLLLHVHLTAYSVHMDNQDC